MRLHWTAPRRGPEHAGRPPAGARVESGTPKARSRVGAPCRGRGNGAASPQQSVRARGSRGVAARAPPLTRRGGGGGGGGGGGRGGRPRVAAPARGRGIRLQPRCSGAAAS